MAYLTNTRTACGSTPGRRISVWDLLALYRQRRTLAALDAEALHDLGLTQDQALTEARRPLWDIPARFRG